MQTLDPKLPGLAQEANEAHAEAQASFRSGVEHAVRAGRALAQAKARLAHGRWASWLAGNFDGSERLAQLYMRLARRLPELEDETRNAVAERSLREASREIAEPRTIRVRYDV